MFADTSCPTTAPQFVELAGLFEDAMGQIYYRGKQKPKGGSNNAGLASGLRERLSNLEKTMTSINEYMRSNVPASPTKTASVDPATGRLISPQPIQPFVLQLQFVGFHHFERFMLIQGFAAISTTPQSSSTTGHSCRDNAYIRDVRIIFRVSVQEGVGLPRIR